jgi:hypothetical protein
MDDRQLEDVTAYIMGLWHMYAIAKMVRAK